MSDQSAKDILKEHDLKQTAGRIALLKVLKKADKLLSHKEITTALGDTHYDSVSIYRSLETFVEAGFVHQVEDDQRNRLFALCTCEEGSHCHPHFFCRSCGKWKCLRDYKIPVIAGLGNYYIVEEKRYYLKGICSKCK